MKSKNLVIIFTFIFSTVMGGLAQASVESTCALSTGFKPNPLNTSADNEVASQSYNLCVSEAYRMQAEHANAPIKPGSPPLYTCDQYLQPLVPTYKYQECKATYEGDKANYESSLATYQLYLSQHPDMNTAKLLSPAQVIEDIAARQQASSDRLKTTATVLKTTGGILVGVGGIMLATGIPMAANPVTATAGGLLVKKGIVTTASGAALLVFGTVIQGKSDRIARDKLQTCTDLNKILTKPMECKDTKLQNAIDGTITATNFSASGINSTSDIPPYIDATSGKCKKDAPAECATIVKNSPADCFKATAKNKGISCMAGGKVKSPYTQLANGKVSMNLNGKQVALGAEDFADEASMVKAGFSHDQAAAYFAEANDPNGILAKNGLNAKGELVKGSYIPSSTYSKSSGAVNSGGADGASVMNSKKDEYGPAVEVARTPASAEGLTKEYHGDTIGAEGDNVFKMINRRYNLKQKQNIFLDQ